MTKILLICEGNVGRSQMAQAYYNYYTDSDDASSAGVDPTTPQRYPNLDDTVYQIMFEIEERIDIRGLNHFVKTIELYMVEEADQIFVLCKKELCPDYVTNSAKVAYWDINDPYGKSIEAMRKIRDQIKDKIYSIL